MTVATDNTAFFRARIKALRLQKRKHVASSDHDQAATDEAIRLREQKSLSNCKAYSVHARDVILKSITELRDLVLDKRKGYILCSGAISTYGHSNFMSDSDRRRFDNDSDTAMRQCAKLIRALEAQIAVDETLTEEEQKHLKAVTHLLNIYLKDVCRIVAQLRAVHLKKTQNLQRICRLANLVDMYEANIDTIRRVEDAQKNRLDQLQSDIDARTAVYDKNEQGWKTDPGWEDAEESFFDTDASAPPSKPEVPAFAKDGIRKRGATSDVHRPHTGLPVAIDEDRTHEDVEPLTHAEEAQLLEENEGLFERLSHTNSDIQHVEKQLAEIQRLQETFTEKVLEQERSIDVIHTQTVYTLDNLETANEFIREAIKNGASRRVIALFCLIVLTLTLLFLDWYNP